MDNRNNLDIVFFGKYHRNLKGLFDLCMSDPYLSERCILLTNESDFLKLSSKNLPVAIWSTHDGHQHTWNGILECRSIVYEDTDFFYQEQGLYEFIQRTRPSDLPRLVQLWHGLPFKDIGKKALLRHTTFEAFQNFYRFLHSTNDFLVPEMFASESGLRLVQEEFNEVYMKLFPHANLFVAPEPKWLTYSAASSQLLKLNKHHKKSLVLYAPTFREESGSWSIKIVNELIEKSMLADIELVWRPHQHDKVLKSLLIENGIPFMSSGSDLYDILPHFSGVITDYSSIIFDCLAINMPVVSFCFDFDYYADRHGFIVGFDKVFPQKNSFFSVDEVISVLSLQIAKKVHKISAPFPHSKEFWMDKLHELRTEN